MYDRKMQNPTWFTRNREQEKMIIDGRMTVVIISVICSDESSHFMTQIEAFTCSGSHMLEIHTHTNLQTLYFTPQLELN